MLSTGGTDDEGCIAALGVVHAVDQGTDVIRACPVDRELAIRAGARREYTAGQVGQIGEVAPVERHLRDLRVGGDVAPHAALRVQCRRRIGDGNGLAGGADFQRDVEAQFLIDFQGEFRPLVVAESGAGRFL